MDVTKNIDEQLKELKAKMTPTTIESMTTAKIVSLIAAFSYKAIRLEEIGGFAGMKKNIEGQVENLKKAGVLDDAGGKETVEAALDSVRTVLMLTDEYMPMLEEELNRRVPAP